MNPNSVNSLLLHHVNKALMNLGEESFFKFIKQNLKDFSSIEEKEIDKEIENKNLFKIVGWFLDVKSQEEFILLLKKSKNYNRIISKDEFNHIVDVISNHFGISHKDIILKKTHNKDRKDAIAVISYYLIKYHDLEAITISKLLLRGYSTIYQDYYRILSLDSRIPEDKDLLDKINTIKLTLQNK